MKYLQEIRQRKLAQWGMTYLAGAWLTLQVLHTFGSLYGWPQAVLRTIPIVLGAGFLAALVLAWYHGERGEQRVTGVELGILTGLLLLGGVGVAAVGAGTDEEEPSPTATAGDAFGGKADLASIAVLPFNNVSSDPEQEYFSDGLTEEIQNALAQIPGLRVAARTSSFVFKDRDVPIDSIGRALRVAHVVEGSVRKAGDRVRISAQLIEVATGFQRWSRTYERELSDIFAVQDEISREIASQLELDLGTRGPLVREETSNPEAYTAVLRGLSEYRQLSRSSRERAEEAFREAIRRDPSYARAHAMLARMISWRAYWRHVPRERYEEAILAADRALELDPSLAVAHAVRGEIANLYQWDFAAADRHLRRAVELNAGETTALNSLAWLHSRLGRHDEAEALARRGITLDPLSAAAHNTLGLVLFYSRRMEEAEEAFKTAAALAPRYPASALNLAQLYSVTGQSAEALEQAQRLATLEPGTSPTIAALASTYARAGRREEARALLRELEGMSDFSPVRLADVHLALGDHEKAVDYLVEAIDVRDEHANGIAVSPVFDAVRQHPRFRAALRERGLD